MICFVNLKENAIVEKFIRVFNNRITTITKGGKHFVGFPTHHQHALLLKPGGRSYVVELSYDPTTFLLFENDLVNINLAFPYNMIIQQPPFFPPKTIPMQPFTYLIQDYIAIINKNKEKLLTHFSNFDEYYRYQNPYDKIDTYKSDSDFFLDLIQYIQILSFVNTLIIHISDKKDIFDNENLIYILDFENRSFYAEKKVANASDGKKKTKTKTKKRKEVRTRKEARRKRGRGVRKARKEVKRKKARREGKSGCNIIY